MGLSWKARPALQTCSFCLLGNCWGEKTVKPQREGLQAVIIQLPSHPGVGIRAGCNNAR